MEYLMVFIEMMPFFFVLDLMPKILAAFVDDYVRRRCFIVNNAPSPPTTPAKKPSPAMLRQPPLQGLAIYNNVAGEEFYMMAVVAVLVAPLLEEIVFRGIPILIDPSGTLAWFGTVGWALAHPVKEVLYIGLCKPARNLAILNAVVMSVAFLSSGVFYMLIWLRGFAYGVVAIAYHCIHNLIQLSAVLVSEIRRRGRMAKLKNQKRRIEQPLPPIEQPSKRVLRDIGLENNVVASEPDEAKKLAQTLYAVDVQRRVLRTISKVSGNS